MMAQTYLNQFRPLLEDNKEMVEDLLVKAKSYINYVETGDYGERY